MQSFSRQNVVPSLGELHEQVGSVKLPKRLVQQRPETLAVFAVRDRITGSEGPVRTVIVGATQDEDGKWALLRDWELIKLLNPLADKPRSQVLAAETGTETGVLGLLAAAQQHVESHLAELDLPFKLPTVERLACLVPGMAETATHPQ